MANENAKTTIAVVTETFLNDGNVDSCTKHFTRDDSYGITSEVYVRLRDAYQSRAEGKILINDLSSNQTICTNNFDFTKLDL